MKKNILFISAEANIVGGGEVSLLNLIKNLSEDFVPFVLLPNKGNLIKKFEKLGIKFFVLEIRKKSFFDLLFSFKKIKEIFDIIKLNNIDIVHCNASSSRETFYSLIASKIAKIPFMWHVRIADKEIITDIIFSLFADKIIVISEFVKERFFIFKNKIEVVYNGVDLKHFSDLSARRKIREEFGIKEDEILVGNIGRLDKWKRQDVFLKTAKLLVEKNKNFKFIIVGDGKELDNLEKLARKLNIENKVIFTGFRDDVSEVLSAFDIFLHTAEREHFGRVIIEAMAKGIPIVACASGGIPEIIKNNFSGILFDKLNPEDISNRILEIIDNSEFRKKVLISAKEEVKKFSVLKHVEHIEKIYLYLLKRKLLFICPFFTSFIRRDIEILKKHYELDILNYRKRLDIVKLVYKIFKNDIIFSWFIFTYATISGMLARILGKKSYVVVGGGDIAEIEELGYGVMRNAFSRFKVKLALKFNNRVFAVSNSIKREIGRYYIGNNVKVVYNGVPIEKFYIGEKKQRVLTVALSMEKLYIKRKGLDYFVDAARYLEDIEFCLVAGISDNESERFEKSAPSNVKFYGFLEEKGLLDLYATSKVYCQLSYHEGFGVALVEAMLSGCVPVVTDKFSLPEVVGDTGYIVKYGEINEIVSAIKQALHDNEKGFMARERAIDKFSLENRERRLIEEIGV